MCHQNCCCCRPGCACLIVGITLAVIGCGLIGCAFLFTELVEYELHKQVVDTIVIDSPSHQNYDQFIYNYGHTLPYNYYNIYLFNITNYESVLKNGTKPILQQLGPYTYYYLTTKFDVKFSGDGKYVTYNEYQRYIFLPERSNGTQSDIVYNINPAYLGVLASAGGEAQLLAGFCGPSVMLIIEFLQETFVQDVLATSSPALLANRQQAFMQYYLQQNPNGTADDALQYFLDFWANATQTPAPYEQFADLAASLASSPIAALEISAESATALFNPALSYALTNSSNASAIAWSRAIYNYNNSAAEYRALLAAEFNLSTSQLEGVLSWLSNAFYPTDTAPFLLARYTIDELSDLAFVQWGTGAVTGGVSVAVWFPEKFGTAIPEYYIYMRDSLPVVGATPLPAPVAKNALNGTYGIFDINNVAAFIEASATANATAASQWWGLSTAEMEYVFLYLLHVIDKFSYRDLENIFAQGGGLMTARNVSDWLFNGRDPLLEVIMPELADVGLIINYTSIENTRETQVPSTFYTGKGGDDYLKKIASYTNFQGLTEIKGVFNFTEKILGTNEEGQFQPFIDRDTILYVFDPNYVRPIKLEVVAEVEHKGVSMLRYEVSNETLLPNPKYFQSIQGFANLTGYHNGTPVFLSNPHWFGADQQWFDQVEGMVPNITTDLVVVDIEPHIGKVMWFSQGLQVNMYIESEQEKFMFNVFNPRVRTGLFYPIMFTVWTAELTEDNADMIKDKIYFALKVKTVGYWVMIGVGIFSAVAAIPLIIIAIVRKRRWQNASSSMPNYLSLRSTM